MELFYAGILPIEVDDETGEELLVGKPFDGCRAYDMYTPFDTCAASAGYEVVCQMMGTDTYSEVLLPMLLRELTDKGGYYSKRLDWDIMHYLRTRIMQTERTTLLLWLSAYFRKGSSDASVYDKITLLWLSQWDAPNMSDVLDDIDI